MSIRLNEDQKRVFVDTYLRYRADGSISRYAAFKAAKMELTAAHRLVPSWSTFQKWLREGINADADQTADQDSVETEAPETDPEAEAEDQAEDPEAAADYTYRLELMVRLYRRKSERDVDAVCDRLLPELATEEE